MDRDGSKVADRATKAMDAVGRGKDDLASLLVRAVDRQIRGLPSFSQALTLSTISLARWAQCIRKTKDWALADLVVLLPLIKGVLKKDLQGSNGYDFFGPDHIHMENADITQVGASTKRELHPDLSATSQIASQRPVAPILATQPKADTEVRKKSLTSSMM